MSKPRSLVSRWDAASRPTSASPTTSGMVMPSGRRYAPPTVGSSRPSTTRGGPPRRTVRQRPTAPPGEATSSCSSSACSRSRTCSRTVSASGCSTSTGPSTLTNAYRSSVARCCAARRRCARYDASSTPVRAGATSSVVASVAAAASVKIARPAKTAVVTRSSASGSSRSRRLRGMPSTQKTVCRHSWLASAASSRPSSSAAQSDGPGSGPRATRASAPDASATSTLVSPRLTADLSTVRRRTPLSMATASRRTARCTCGATRATPSASGSCTSGTSTLPRRRGKPRVYRCAAR